ncbi:MAG: prephenate dehydrogenase/arogenate dehydrogenase family protein [Actinobacteria bacterium]|nr:prephenate dehydrogenase/arogenate dehydrogenase family protein [Actinomycetota bacterium]
MRVAVLGCGLMGTSIAMASSRNGDDVAGWDPDADVLLRSSRRAGFTATSSLKEAVDGAELVLVCAPTASLADVAAEALTASSTAIVTDIGSVKTPVNEQVASLVGESVAERFVGGHPMCGSERSGPDVAAAALLDGSVWVIAPGGSTDPSAVATLSEWVAALGAKPMVMDPLVHDRVVAVVSHLPQVVSTALMGLAAREEEGVPETLVLAAGGFRDLTRLAASNPHLWAEILRSNGPELKRAIDLLIEDLGALKEELDLDEPGRLEETLSAATKARLSLGARPKVRAGVAVVQVPIPDKPGALAELTSGMSELGVNIEDLQIVHSPEGGRGTVHLTVAASDADAAVAAAEKHGYEAYRIA